MFDGCGRKAVALGYCQTHRRQLRDNGELRPIREQAPRGSGWMTPSGYRYVSIMGHPNASTHGRVAEHVVVMVEKIGRPLVRGESVHHINGVRHDNRPENLELWSTAQPYGQRVEDKVAWAREILALYAPGSLR